MADPKEFDSPYPVIGQLALKHGLVAKEALDLAWKACMETSEPVSALADYLLAHQLVSPLDMKRILTASRAMKMRRKDVKFGTLAIEKGYISTGLLKLALDQQKQELIQNKRSKLLGDILVEAGMITTRQCNDILKEQNRLKKSNQDTGEQALPSPESSPKIEKLFTQGFNPTTAASLERGMTLTFAKDAIAAFLSKTDDFDETITVQEIKKLLARHYIVFGIVDDTLINGFIKSKAFKTKPFRVALGIKPQRPVDAVVKYFFITNRLKVGEIDEKGNIDFRERGKIPRVAADDILAERIPPLEGVAGKNVFGNNMPVPPARDIKLKYKRGAKFSRDGLKIIARIDGEPKLSWSGSISVLDEIIIDNVDYETGHIDYPGNVKIKGCIQNGFKVTGENIRANEIDGGIIHADGNLSVGGGINEAVIYAKGKIWAKFIHKSTIRCLGDIFTTKEIVESTIETGGACIINQGSIIASTITAKMGIKARHVGTERSIPSSLIVGKDLFVLKEIAALKKKIIRIRQQIMDAGEKKQNLEAKLRREQENASRLAHIEENSMAMQKETLTQIASLNPVKNQDELNLMRTRLQTLKQEASEAQEALSLGFETVERVTEERKILLKTLSAQMEQLEDLIQELINLKKWTRENPGIAQVDVTGSLMAKTSIMGHHAELKVKRDLQRTTIREIMLTSPGKDQTQDKWEMQITPG